MPGLLDDIMSAVGPQVTNELSSKLKMDQGTAAQLLPQIAPMILGGLKRQMQNHGGPDRVNHILNKYGDQSVLGDIGGLFSQKAADPNPDPRLGGLLGESGVQAANMISKNFNLDGNTAAKLIPMLAPIVLGALSQKRDQGGAGSSGIASLIDQDGDGNILDDVAGFLLGGLTGGAQQQQPQRGAGGLLGSLLGGLFGGRRR